MKIPLMNIDGCHDIEKKTLTISEVWLRKVLRQKAMSGGTPFTSIEEFIDAVVSTGKHAVVRELKIMPGSPSGHTKRSRVLVITNFGPSPELII